MIIAFISLCTQNLITGNDTLIFFCKCKFIIEEDLQKNFNGELFVRMLYFLIFKKWK